MPDWLWAALALVLIVEGLLPFVAPKLWRNTFSRLVEMSDGQLRFIGLTAIVIGVVGLAFFGNA